MCVTSCPGLLPALRESDVGGTVMLKWHCLRWIVRNWLVYPSVQGLFSPFLGFWLQIMQAERCFSLLLVLRLSSSL
jgi:hypothetical protein